MIKALIADDQELIRQGLQIMFSNRPDIIVTGVAPSGQKAVRSVRKSKLDVILMDIRMSKLDGVQCAEITKGNYPQIKIIILTTFDDNECVYNALKYGASGYLSEGVSMDGLVNAITTVYNGWVMINPDIATKVLKLFPRMVQANCTILMGDKSMDELTKTEWKIIAQVEKGANSRGIVEVLKLSERTVRNYLSTVLNELNLRGRTRLAIWAVQTNIKKRLGT